MGSSPRSNRPLAVQNSLAALSALAAIVAITGLLVFAAFVSPAHAHDAALRPRTGLVSEEVARQREAPRPTSSSATGAGAASATSAASAPESHTPDLIRDHSIKVSRDDIAGQKLIVEPFAEDRPNATRPSGDKPAAAQPERPMDFLQPPRARPKRRGRM
jgi:cytoskeletal protein RodZ